MSTVEGLIVKLSDFVLKTEQETIGLINAMFSAGKKLRELRERVGLTLRDVEIASTRLSETRGIEDYLINPSRLSDIETKGILPNIYRIYALSVIYRTDFGEILKLYGVDLGSTAADLNVSRPAKTHRLEIISDRGSVSIPVRLDPAFDLRRTANLGRMIENWGIVPLQFVQELAKRKFTYGYIGIEDLTMYPLIMPGSFVQVDEERNRVEEGHWHSELERPVYFVETREGYVCSWCSRRRGELVLQSHPLSPVLPRFLKYPQEAEVIGQVIGVAMRLGDRNFAAEQQSPEENPESVEGATKEVRRH